MPFNKIHLKRFGIALMSYVIACIVMGVGTIAGVELLYPGETQGVYIVLPMIFVSFICFALGSPFALIGSFFYIFETKFVNWKKLLLVCWALGFSALFFGIWSLNLLDAWVLFLIGALVCPPLTIFLTYYFDKKWLQK